MKKITTPKRSYDKMPDLTKPPRSKLALQGYDQLLTGIQRLLEEARHQAARSVNAILTATYWEIGRRIVVHEQGGKARAGYGEELLKRISEDLTSRIGRGFGISHVKMMRQFHLTYSNLKNRQSLIGRSAASKKSQSLIGELQGKPEAHYAPNLPVLMDYFPLSWTHYAHLLRVKSDYGRNFYESESIRSGWSVRQLERQIESQFYERTAMSRDKASMLKKGALKKASDKITPAEEIKDPYVLEFLGLKDEYSESDLEEALIRHLETFLLELGGDFTFVARQRRLRIGGEWYRVDLVFYHRVLRCLVLIDLKIGKFTHADAGQMHLYLNYAREHWTHPDENPPVGLILCAKKDSAVAHYALEGLQNKVLAAEYRTALPEEKKLTAEINRTQLRLEHFISINSLRKSKTLR
jgi:predicted nuclease of restriction endonuclease-like (RecB) superfamily